METCDHTNWTMIVEAAEGSRSARDSFARAYLPAVTAYFRARWRGSELSDDVEDAVQEVFLDCFRDEGALARADPALGRFRAFLYGIARNVGRRHEERRGHRREHQAADSSQWAAVARGDSSLGRVFDRVWAETLVRQARARHAEAARAGDEHAQRRYELLRLRFEDGLPIRTIAERWKESPARVHHEYADARAEFRQHLLRVVAASLHAPTAESTEAECAGLLECLRLDGRGENVGRTGPV